MVTEDGSTLVKYILDSGNSLCVLMDDLLEATKIETSQLRLQFAPFNINALFEQIRASYIHLVELKGLSFVTEVAESVPIIIGDAVRIKQVIVNLISNSLKFTKHGYIKVKASGTPIDSDHWQLDIHVEDTGSGVDPDLQDKIFHEFFSSAESLQMGGSGLGLSVCKNIIHEMGGCIHFSSAPQHGAIFWFSIALEIAPLPLQASPKSLKFNYRVLIVDDSPVNVKVMMNYLSQLGCAFETAYDGDEAVNLAEHSKFDIILMVYPLVA